MEDKILDLLAGNINIIVHKDKVTKMLILLLLLHILLGCLQPSIQAISRLGSPRVQPIPERTHRRRPQEDNFGVQVQASNREDSLPVQIQDTALSLLLDVLDGLFGSSIAVAGKLGVLYKLVLRDHAFELVVGDKVVLTAILFTFSWFPGRVYKRVIIQL